ncbi:MAG: aminotransferase class V-fold PLP-dependent enzyme [Janthinobacterium lividum]
MPWPCAHARAEAECGGYVAAADACAQLDAAREHIRHLLGWSEGSVAFVHSAEDALRQLLLHWPHDLPVLVAHPRGEYGPNMAVLRQLGIATAVIDGAHRIDPGAVEQLVARERPDLVHVTWLGSHRGTVQPVADIAAVCSAAGVPLVIDAAQAFGHLDTTQAAHADVVYATSRKWLAGPRGVGFLAVRGSLAERMSGLEQAESHVAGRVGLATALAEHLDLGAGDVHAGLATVGVATRHQLAQELAGSWSVVEDLDEPSAIVTLRSDAGADIAAVRGRLLAEDDILTTHLGVERAPAEMRVPALRVSGHLDTGSADIARLVQALRRS